MGLVLVSDGSLSQLAKLLTVLETEAYYGLWQGEWQPAPWNDITDVVPATFSGYSGLQLATGWQPAYLHNGQAVSEAADLSWFHNGGPVSNWIGGYYVVNVSGVLQWAERYPGASRAMVLSGNVYRVTPRYGFGSRYP